MSSLKVSRRALLSAGISSAASCLLPPSSAYATISPLPEILSPKLPAGSRLRGANQVGKFNRVRKDTIWGDFWRSWDWNGLIRPQLEDIATVANAVRFWGNTLPIADGSVTLSDYLSRWQQVLAYSLELGLQMYPCGGDLKHWGEIEWNQAVLTYSELCQMLSGHPNVVGVDITNEASDALRATPSKWVYHQPEPAIDLLEKLGSVARDNNLPVTHSRSVHSAVGWLEWHATDSMGDFLDFHVYYPPARSDSAVVYNQSWGEGKRLIVGEFGIDTKASPSERADFYRAIRTMCSTDVNCVGAFAWSAWDLSDSSQWGLFDSNRRLRPDIGQIFKTFQTTP